MGNVSRSFEDVYLECEPMEALPRPEPAPSAEIVRLALGFPAHLSWSDVVQPGSSGAQGAQEAQIAPSADSYRTRGLRRSRLIAQNPAGASPCRFESDLRHHVLNG